MLSGTKKIDGNVYAEQNKATFFKKNWKLAP